ncbi:MAG: hypothetical protein LRS49_05805 [Desulfurococcales archaeon]|nr:hypothetical protein [Desulfurococcales archaeon]
MGACDYETVAESYLSLGEALAAVRSEPRGSEVPLAQLFVVECGSTPNPVSLGGLLGEAARDEMLEAMAERGVVPVASGAVPPDSLAHLLVYLGLLVLAEARGDETASTARLRIIDDLLVPAIRELRRHGGYCEALLAEAAEEVLGLDMECLGVAVGGAASEE